MAKLDNAKKAIEPSVNGIVWYFLIALAAVIVNAHYLNSLLTTKTSGRAIPRITNTLSSVLTWTNNEMLSHLGVSTSNNLVVGLTWGFIGLIVYVLCAIVVSFFRRLIEIYQLKEYVMPSEASRSQELLEPLGKLLLQLLMMVVLFVYIIWVMAPIMLGYLLPVPGHGKIDLPADLLWIVLCVFVLHGFVMILRLLFLRERLGEQSELPETHNL